MISWSKPDYGNDEIDAAVEVARSGWVTQGKVTEAFEKDIEGYTGARDVTVVNNGTSALIAALIGHGVGPGDEVVVPSLTFIASVNSIISVGAKPVLADSDPKTWNTTPKLVAEKITGRTKAIMPVDVAGMPIDIEGFEKLAGENNIALIEDAAAAIGGEYKGRKMGSFGHTSTFSFHIAKSLQTVEGGCVLTDDEDFGKRLKRIRNHGMTHPYDPKKNLHYDYSEFGLNFRITDIQSAIGRAQVRKVDMQVEARNRIVDMYKKELKGSFGFQVVPEYVTKHPYLFFGVMAREDERDSLARYLVDNGVDIRICWLPAHQQRYHRNIFADEALPGAEEVGKRAIELPLGGVSKEDAMKVIEVIKGWG